MPLILERNINPQVTVAIWEMNESMETLLHSGISIDSSHKEKRQREWISTRLLLQKIAPNSCIFYKENGAPILSDGRAISISHSKEYCSILISPQKAAIDLELISGKAHRLKSQFVSPEEEGLITDSNISTLLWSSKECLYKLHQKGQLIFKEDLLIKEITENKLHSSLKGESICLHFEKFNNHYLVYYYE